jgi:hypothetical protein
VSGIEVTHQWADLARYAAEGQDPVGIVSRGAQEEWQVAMTPIEAGRPIKWSLVKDGDAVYVPLVPYRVAADPARSFAFLLEVGVLAGLQVNMTRGPIRAIRVIRGEPVEDLRPELEAFRVWVGLAVRIK